MQPTNYSYVPAFSMLVEKAVFRYTFRMYRFSLTQRRAIVIFALLVAVVCFSGFLHLGVDRVGGGTASCSALMGQVFICKMHPLEHISAWQTMFTSVVVQDVTMLLYLLLAALLLARVIIALAYHPALAAPHSHALHRECIPARTHLSYALARGIVHPKIF